MANEFKKERQANKNIKTRVIPRNDGYASPVYHEFLQSLEVGDADDQIQ